VGSDLNALLVFLLYYFCISSRLHGASGHSYDNNNSTNANPATRALLSRDARIGTRIMLKVPCHSSTGFEDRSQGS